MSEIVDLTKSSISNCKFMQRAIFWQIYLCGRCTLECIFLISILLHHLNFKYVHIHTLEANFFIKLKIPKNFDFVLYLKNIFENNFSMFKRELPAEKDTSIYLYVT